MFLISCLMKGAGEPDEYFFGGKFLVLVVISDAANYYLFDLS